MRSPVSLGRKEAGKELEIFHNTLHLQNPVTEIIIIDEMLAVLFRKPESYTRDGEGQCWNHGIPDRGEWGAPLECQKDGPCESEYLTQGQNKYMEPHRNRCKEAKDMTDSRASDCKGNQKGLAWKQASSHLPRGDEPWGELLAGLRVLVFESDSHSPRTQRALLTRHVVGNEGCAEPTLMLPETPAWASSCTPSSGENEKEKKKNCTLVQSDGNWMRSGDFRLGRQDLWGWTFIVAASSYFGAQSWLKELSFGPPPVGGERKECSFEKPRLLLPKDQEIMRALKENTDRHIVCNQKTVMYKQWQQELFQS